MKLDLEIIDYNIFVGMFSMSRESNRINDVRELKWGFPACNTMLMPGMGGNLSGGGLDEFTAHLQLLVRVRSGLALALRDISSPENVYPAT